MVTRPSTRRLRLLGIITMILAAAWATAGLIFRYSLYASLPIAPGDPYGIADILEFFHYVVLLALSAVVFLEGAFLLVFGRFHLRRLAIALLLFACALPLAERHLHGWVALLAIE